MIDSDLSQLGTWRRRLAAHRAMFLDAGPPHTDTGAPVVGLTEVEAT